MVILYVPGVGVHIATAALLAMQCSQCDGTRLAARFQRWTAASKAPMAAIVGDSGCRLLLVTSVQVVDPGAMGQPQDG